MEIATRSNQPGQEGSFSRESIASTKQLSVPSRVASVSFKFVALSFRAPERNQYLYRLEGFDQGWRKAGAEQRATYTNLNPGTYYFRVKASNNTGVWNEQGATLELVVLPAWWQTFWFKTGITGFFVLFVGVVSWILAKRRYRRRLAKAQSENKHLQELQEASAALKDSDERLNFALEAADLGTWDWNIESGQYVIDHRWAQITGHSSDELVSQYQAWIDRINPEDLSDVLQIMGTHLSGATPNFEAEYRLRHKDGHWIRVLHKGRVVQRDSAGKALRMSGTFQDVSARQQSGGQKKAADESSTRERYLEFPSGRPDDDLNDW
jgi:PAS domain S-box-containing protein